MGEEDGFTVSGSKTENKEADFEQQGGQQDTFQEFFEQEVSGGQEYDR